MTQHRPIELVGGLLDSVGGKTRRVQSTYDRTNAGADNKIRGNARGLQYLQHSDMREPAKRTTAEGESDHGSPRTLHLREWAGFRRRNHDGTRSNSRASRQDYQHQSGTNVPLAPGNPGQEASDQT